MKKTKEKDNEEKRKYAIHLQGHTFGTPRKNRKCKWCGDVKK